MRRMLLGLVAVLAVCGTGAAKPPVVEGREVAPVAEKRGDTFGWAFVVALHEALIHRFAMPLGTAQADEMR